MHRTILVVSNYSKVIDNLCIDCCALQMTDVHHLCRQFTGAVVTANAAQNPRHLAPPRSVECCLRGRRGVAGPRAVPRPRLDWGGAAQKHAGHARGGARGSELGRCGGGERGRRSRRGRGARSGAAGGRGSDAVLLCAAGGDDVSRTGAAGKSWALRFAEIYDMEQSDETQACFDRRAFCPGSV